jgi:hypothetical protein
MLTLNTIREFVGPMLKTRTAETTTTMANPLSRSFQEYSLILHGYVLRTVYFLSFRFQAVSPPQNDSNAREGQRSSADPSPRMWGLVRRRGNANANADEH